ncbi:MAG: aquaporin family protein [Propionibacteriaceae bacterium]|nr:aquaporin family protein [Propionibacteriaceae bacterium]
MLLDVSLGQIFLSEFAGTAILLLLGTGVVANTVFNESKGSGTGWLLINWGWGIGVFAGVLVAFKSGGHLNPAVTIGKVVAHMGDSSVTLAAGVPVTAGNVTIYLVAQVLGAFVGAGLCWLTYKKQFDIPQPEGTKLGVFSTGPAIRSLGWNCVTEAIGTFVLVTVVLLSGYQGNAGNMGWLNALGVALLIVGIGASLGGPTGYAINPARDLGPRLWHAVMPVKDKGSSDWGYAWVPIVGPIIGGVLAALVYLAFNGAFGPIA